MKTYTPHGEELGRVMAQMIGKSPAEQVQLLVKELAQALAIAHQVLTKQESVKNDMLSRWTDSGRREVIRSAKVFIRKMETQNRDEVATAMKEWLARFKSELDEITEP